ncbi:MAG TPA: PASTA domain-containing protein [Terriglobia bacterium]|nr:PASTA domain-containing protein [Terriglobia bacterium]
MGFVSRVRTLFRLFLLASVLVAVALMSAITTIRITIHSGEERAPNLVGLSIDQADRLAGGIGLGVKVNDHLFDSKFAADHVVSQAPAPGDSTKSGQDIYVLVSLGRPTITVPMLVGESVRAAQVTAEQRGLTLGDIVAVHWNGTASDYVVAQDPPPSSQPARSPVTNLLVSLGEPTQEFVCPSFIGMPLERARNELARAGFKAGEVQSPAPPAASANPAAASAEAAPQQPQPAPPPPAAPAAPSGTIVSQSPAPGSKVSPDTSFSFTVAP